MTESKPNGHDIATASPANKKRFAQILVEINANFDETTGKYLNQKSDETIAKQFDVNPKVVSEIREQYVGKLAREPDEMDKLKAEHDAAWQLLVGEIDGLKAKIKIFHEDFERRYDKVRSLMRSEGH